MMGLRQLVRKMEFAFEAAEREQDLPAGGRGGQLIGPLRGVFPVSPRFAPRTRVRPMGNDPPAR
jgi:hypothetical protein